MRNLQAVAIFSSALCLSACGGNSGPGSPPLDVDGGEHALCSMRPGTAPLSSGDEALCTVPKVTCLAEELLSVTQCHYPPSPSPATACCAPLPAGCATDDCDCLLRNGPWIDFVLAEDALTASSEVENVERCLHAISSRDAEILRMRYGLGGRRPMTLKEIGDKVNLSRERVRQIENEALRKLNYVMTRKREG